MYTWTEKRSIVEQIEQVRPLRRTLAEIMDFQHERLLERYRESTGTSLEWAARCFNAFKQFMIVCAVKPGYKVTSDPIDQMWHTFLLFTRDYRMFCEDNLGRFINHEPFEQAYPSAYVETRAFANEYFGELDEEFWNLDAKADCSSGCYE